MALTLPWDFDPSGVKCSVTWWHGEHDANVPVGSVRCLLERIPTWTCGCGRTPAISRRTTVTTRCSPSYWPAEAIDVFIRPVDAERAIEEVRGEDPEMAASCGSRSGRRAQAS